MNPEFQCADLDLADIGASSVALDFALHTARKLPEARIALYDARPLDVNVSRAPRVHPLSLRSV